MVGVGNSSGAGGLFGWWDLVQGSLVQQEGWGSLWSPLVSVMGPLWGSYWRSIGGLMLGWPVVGFPCYPARSLGGPDYRCCFSERLGVGRPDMPPLFTFHHQPQYNINTYLSSGVISTFLQIACMTK